MRGIYAEFPISTCLCPKNAPLLTRAIVLVPLNLVKAGGGHLQVFYFSKWQDNRHSDRREGSGGQATPFICSSPFPSKGRISVNFAIT
jgi:hypothetical protein